MNDKDEILKSLEPLFKEAAEKGLWFYCNYQDIFYSPKELRDQQQKGSFVWGPQNWILRDPQEYLLDLRKKVLYVEEAVMRFKKRMEAE